MTGAMLAVMAMCMMAFHPAPVGNSTNAEARAARYTVSANVAIPGFYWRGDAPMPPERLLATVAAAIERCPHIPNRPDWILLVFETALAETDGGYFLVPWRSPGDLGAFQIREETATDTLVWLRATHPDAYRALMSFYDHKSTLTVNLEHNAPFGAALCATYYWRRAPRANIRTRAARAELWKREYNTARGKGDVARYLTAQR